MRRSRSQRRGSIDGARAAAALLVLFAACGGERPAGLALHLRVLSTHDVHGALSPAVYGWSEGERVGGMAALETVMDGLEGECGCPTLRVDGGDQMQGTLESNLTRGEAMVAAFNRIGLDAAAVGNHDLDWGVETLRARQRQARYPWLAANVFRRADGERPEWARPFAVVEKDGVRVGIVGYTTVRTPSASFPEVGERYEFRSGYASLRDALLGVARQSPDFVVLVAHAEGECRKRRCSGEAVELAAGLPPGAVDLIVGGHEHYPGEGVVQGIPIVRAGSEGQAVGVTDLYRRADGTRSFTIGRREVLADAVEPDPGMTALLEPYRRAAEALGNERVTTLTERLSRSASGDRRLGKLVAEAIRRAAGADFGIQNPGGTRADLPAGPVTYADVYRVLPFGNAIARVTLTGAELRRVVEQAGPRFYLANLHAEFGERPGTGARTAQLRFPDGAPVEAGRTYVLAAPDFVAEGGDGLQALAALPREGTGTLVLDAVLDHLRALPAPVVLPVERERPSRGRE